jgi:hypothetical protein
MIHLASFQFDERVFVRSLSGDNRARILYYELQYNTSFQQNDWISVPIEQRRESFNEVKSADGSIKLEPKTTSRRTNSTGTTMCSLAIVLDSFQDDTFAIESVRSTGSIVVLGKLHVPCDCLQSYWRERAERRVADDVFDGRLSTESQSDRCSSVGNSVDTVADRMGGKRSSSISTSNDDIRSFVMQR